jgi:hypothetical protein
MKGDEHMKRCAGRKSRKHNLMEEWRKYLSSLPPGSERDRKLKLQAFLEEVVAETPKEHPRRSGRSEPSDIPF